MADVSFQDVFNRVFSYLRESGVEMTVETYRSLLRLMEEAVASVDEPNRGDRILAAAMDRVPRYFRLPEVEPPQACPPITRGSIGYDHHD